MWSELMSPLSQACFRRLWAQSTGAQLIWGLEVIDIRRFLVALLGDQLLQGQEALQLLLGEEARLQVQEGGTDQDQVAIGGEPLGHRRAEQTESHHVGQVGQAHQLPPQLARDISKWRSLGSLMMATCLALSWPGRKAERSMAMVSTQNRREYWRHQWLTTYTSLFTTVTSNHLGHIEAKNEVEWENVLKCCHINTQPLKNLLKLFLP